LAGVGTKGLQGKKKKKKVKGGTQTQNSVWFVTGVGLNQREIHPKKEKVAAKQQRKATASLQE